MEFLKMQWAEPELSNKKRVTRNKHENINVDYKIIEEITSKHKPRKNKNV